MTTTESRLTPPRPVELVPADEAGALIDSAHRELADLEQRAEQARATADETRARAEREGADERASAWAIVRLQRFLDNLRDEAEQDARVVVAAAQRSADTAYDPIVDDAPPVRTAPAARIVRTVPVEDPAPVTPVERETTLAPADVHVPPAADIATDATAPVVPVVPVVAAVPEPPAPAPDAVPAMTWTASPPDAPASNGHVAAADVAPLIEEPLVPVAAPLTAPVAVVAPPVAAAPAAAPAAPVAPVAAAAPQRRRFLHGFPLSAALEVLAVLLVLAFILLRLS